MIGQTLQGRYTIVRKMGEGGMGAVYEARQTSTGRRVAVKVITTELAKSPRLVERFEREAKVIGSLESEHIAKVLDFGRDDALDAPFFAMELLVGEDVHAVLQRLGTLPEDVALRIGVQACLGLEKAHAKGVVHRDIKPANLFLTECDGGELRLKLLDFGIAKVSHEALAEGEPEKKDLTRTGSLLGSPRYMSPEQARGRGELDLRSDLWSLGVVLYQALTGRTPFDDEEAIGDLIIALMSTPVAPILSLAPGVHPGVAEAVERALVIDPRKRYQSAAEMRAALASFLPQGATILASMLQPGGAPLSSGLRAAPSSGAPGTTPAPRSTTSPAAPAVTERRAASSPPGTGETATAPSPGHEGGFARHAGALPPTAARTTTGSAPPTAPIASGASTAVSPGQTSPGDPVAAQSLAGTRASAAPPSVAFPKSALLIGAGVVAIAGAALGAVFAVRLNDRTPAPAAAATSAAPAEHHAHHAAAPPLHGVWWSTSSSTVYNAVARGSSVEFRIRELGPLGAAGYVVGDTHFSVRAIANEANAYHVEVHARPIPPAGTAYEPRARSTCLSMRKSIGARALRAEFADERLVVKLARVELGPSGFVRDGAKVIRCDGLAQAAVFDDEVVVTSSKALAGRAAPSHEPDRTPDAGPRSDGAAEGQPCHGSKSCASGKCVAGTCK